MPRAVPRTWQTFEYFDSREVLLKLRAIEESLADYKIEGPVISLRTRHLRPYNERRQAALFCYGISRLRRHPISYAPVEAEDFDCVARWTEGDTTHYTPIQLKELPPNELNPKVALEAELAKLAKYASSPELCVAFYLNRNLRLDLGQLRIPKLNIAELWLYGATTPDKSTWRLWGNLLASPVSVEYGYPA